MKLCKDCKWLKYRGQYICAHEKSVIGVSNVSGIKTIRYCGEMRESEELCGEEGKLFEKGGWVKRLLG